MITNRFKHKIEELKGLIDDELWSALSDECPCSGPAGPDMLVAVSGGIDSMCMADLFLRCFGPDGFAVAHCNFNLRGEESDGDEAMVKGWAAEHGIRIHENSFPTETYAAEHGISIEMAARELRYIWFADLCVRNGYRYVAVAHHADDNAETMLLNLVRGTGLKGLSGMREISSVPYSDPSLPSRLIRPLLEMSRKQIEGYVFSHRVPYRDDSTNSSVEYRRNRLRHEVLPVLKAVNPSVVATLNREMAYFTEAGEIVDDWCRSVAPSVLKEDGGTLRIGLQTLMSHRHWRYLLYHILEPYGFNSSVLASLEELLTSARTISGKRFESHSHMLLTGRNELTVVPSADHPGTADAIMPVRGEGIYHFNGRRFKVEVICRDDVDSLKQPGGVVMMDAGRLRFPFVLRRWRTGDWFIPFGMRGKKKISDLFSDLRYDAARKSEAVMIVDTATEGMAEDQHVAAVAGVRIDNSYRIKDDTSSIIRITETII